MQQSHQSACENFPDIFKSYYITAHGGNRDLKLHQISRDYVKHILFYRHFRFDIDQFAAAIEFFKIISAFQIGGCTVGKVKDQPAKGILMASTTEESVISAEKPAGDDARNWYVLELQKDKAAVAEANLKAQGFQTFNPQMRATVRQFGKAVKRLQPIFPGYCFIHCSLADGRIRSINSTRGVKRFAGPPGVRPAAVRPSIIETLLGRCPDGVLDTSASDLRVGQEVRLEDCGFAGAIARVHELDAASRVKVLISLLGTERIVSVPRSAVQPAAVFS